MKKEELKPCPYRIHGERTTSLMIPGEYYYNEFFMPCMREECVCFHRDGDDIYCDRNGEYMRLTKRLKKLPSVERKKGEWVGADSQCGIRCPFCGVPVDDFCNSIDYIDLSYEPNYCPNCGADMRGEQE